MGKRFKVGRALGAVALAVALFFVLRHIRITRQNEALSRALQSGESDEARRIIVAGVADVNGGDQGSSFLLQAASRNEIAIVNALIEGGARVAPEEAIFVAIARNDEAGSARLLATHPRLTEVTNANLEPPLKHAVRLGRLGIVKRLLQAGADPNSCIGGSVLEEAVGSGNEPSVRLLLAHGARLQTDCMAVPIYESVRPMDKAVMLPLLKETAARRAKATPGRAQRSLR